MNVLVIAEDFRNDEFVLAPIIGAMMSYLGKPKPTIRVCKDPLIGGYAQATDSDILAEVIGRYKWWVDVFILAVDRDGIEGRRNRLDALEKEASTQLQAGRLFLAAHAVEEIEAWVLAGLDLPKDWSWKDVRACVSVKEDYFEKLAAQRGLSDRLAGGRKTLAEEAARSYKSIRTKCPEVAELEARIPA